MTSATEARRQQFAARVGPHKPVSEVVSFDVPAQPGVAAHRDYVVIAACGREVAPTLVTHQDDRVRCPNCLAAMSSRNEAGRGETKVQPPLEDDLRECSRCGDQVSYLSGRDLCDGCEGEQ
jgi:hypothetical protein